MKFIKTKFRDLVVIESKVHNDNRGFFKEIFKKNKFNKFNFVFACASSSKKNVFRGFHFQSKFAQGKYLTVLKGKVLDVAVDIRKGSPTFGKFESCVLDDKDHKRLYIPEGFAHGYYVLTEIAVFQYMCTQIYHPEDEYGVLWNDSDVSINWPSGEKIVSDRDCKWSNLEEIDPKKLPDYK